MKRPRGAASSLLGRTVLVPAAEFREYHQPDKVYRGKVIKRDNRAGHLIVRFDDRSRYFWPVHRIQTWLDATSGAKADGLELKRSCSMDDVAAAETLASMSHQRSRSTQACGPFPYLPRCVERNTQLSEADENVSGTSFVQSAVLMAAPDASCSTAHVPKQVACSPDINRLHAATAQTACQAPTTPLNEHASAQRDTSSASFVSRGISLSVPSPCISMINNAPLPALESCDVSHPPPQLIRQQQTCRTHCEAPIVPHHLQACYLPALERSPQQAEVHELPGDTAAKCVSGQGASLDGPYPSMAYIMQCLNELGPNHGWNWTASLPPQ